MTDQKLGSDKVMDDIVPYPFKRDKSDNILWLTKRRQAYIDYIRKRIYPDPKNIDLSINKLESYIGAILQDFKQTVYRGSEFNYSDITIFYVDYEEAKGDEKFKSLYLRASISQKKEIRDKKSGALIEVKDDPNFLYWLDILDTVFFPLKDFIQYRHKEKYGSYASNTRI